MQERGAAKLARGANIEHKQNITAGVDIAITSSLLERVDSPCLYLGLAFKNFTNPPCSANLSPLFVVSEQGAAVAASRPHGGVDEGGLRYLRRPV